MSCWVQGQESCRKRFWGNKSVLQAGESLLWLPGLAWPWVPVQLLPTDKAGGSGWGNFSALKHWEGSCAVLGCSSAGPRATTPHLPRAQHAVGSGDAPQRANPRQGISSSSSSVPFSSSCPAAEQQTGGSVPPPGPGQAHCDLSPPLCHSSSWCQERAPWIDAAACSARKGVLRGGGEAWFRS